MKEDSQNSQWTDETYQEIVDSKDTSLQCSPVRKLILDNLLGYVPANEMQVSIPPTGRNICPVTKSNTSNSDMPAIVSASQPIKDSEQTAPINMQQLVTIIAARFRLICNSSWKKAVTHFMKRYQ